MKINKIVVSLMAAGIMASQVFLLVGLQRAYNIDAIVEQSNWPRLPTAT